MECSAADRLPNYPRASHPTRWSVDCGLADDRATVVPILGHPMMIECLNPQLAQVPQSLQLPAINQGEPDSVAGSPPCCTAIFYVLS
jgi:hypothetical protein